MVFDYKSQLLYHLCSARIVKFAIVMVFEKREADLEHFEDLSRHGLEVREERDLRSAFFVAMLLGWQELACCRPAANRGIPSTWIQVTWENGLVMLTVPVRKGTT